MPLFLHLDKKIAEIFDAFRKPREKTFSFACSTGRAMIQGTVSLPPGMLALVRTLATDKEIGARPGQTMEQGVVGRTGCPTQVYLRRLALAAVDEELGRTDKITRLQATSSWRQPVT